MRLIYSVVRKLAEVFFGGRPIGFVRILRANEIAKHNSLAIYDYLSAPLLLGLKPRHALIAGRVAARPFRVCHVLRAICKAQIGSGVFKAIPVDMVNFIGTGQFTRDETAKNDSMKIHLAKRAIGVAGLPVGVHSGAVYLSRPFEGGKVGVYRIYDSDIAFGQWNFDVFGGSIVHSGLHSRSLMPSVATNDAGAFRSPNYSTNFQFVSMKRAEAL